LYYYLLRHVAVSKVALLTLITPICALLIGRILNNEALTVHIILGTVLVLSGLALHQWGESLWAKYSARVLNIKMQWAREKM